MAQPSRSGSFTDLMEVAGVHPLFNGVLSKEVYQLQVLTAMVRL